jgi:hypothetical protein
MLHIKIPFGYNTLMLDHSLIIFTGKIRIKSDSSIIGHNLAHHANVTIQERGAYTTIKFFTTDHLKNMEIIKDINATLAMIMHARIDAKYSNKTWEHEISNEYIAY